MHWKKLGRVYNPKINIDNLKLKSHGANPLPIQIEDDVYRIYFNGRDERNRSSIGALDFDLDKREILKVYKKPVFLHGKKDTFYSNGISLGCTYKLKEVNHIVFMGWSLFKNRQWKGILGRLKIHQNGSLSYEDKYPFFDLSIEDKISISYPYILKENDKSFKMWYGSMIKWNANNGEMLHLIKYATSKNGIDWLRHGNAIPYKINFYQAFSKPCVFKESDNLYHMWFSYRGGLNSKYKIGYAKSNNGLNWKLDLDNSGIQKSESGWDSEMLCYPHIFQHKSNLYMLYNGNGYGETGFGLALLINSKSC
ncbi:MAG: hypothetical protein CBE24_02085 [bacterium TMED264]|nr:MAG: hypothetical protein CBE24_02085 [bacterium TMED264]